MTAPALLDADLALHDAMNDFALDPEGFVDFSYPWGVPGGPLEAYDGPDVWQREALQEIGRQVRARAFDGVRPVLPIRLAVSAGKDVGKGALTAWAVNWIMSTRRHAKGTVTANTETQLQEKTWSEIRTWTARCITAHWFEINSQVMYRKGYRASWKCTPTSCAPENAVAFQGQHNAQSTSFVIFDEASGIDDAIPHAAEGGLMDGEPMMFIFFNPTRSSGYAYEAVFGKGRDRWTTRIVDARTCKMPNPAFIAEWLEDCGGDEDSDFFRVNVRGLPPHADEFQYIDSTRIRQAQTNPIEVIGGEPLVAGVDVSGGGSAWTVCRFRRGNDARSIPPIRLTGEQTMKDDRQFALAKLADALVTHQPDAMFIDAAYGAVFVSRLRQMGFTQVFEVNFGGPSVDPMCANARAHMYKQIKEWLPHGAISKDDVRLATDLGAPGFHLNSKHQLVLESKESLAKRNIASPDDSDALVLTKAMPVIAKARPKAARPMPRSAWG